MTATPSRYTLPRVGKPAGRALAHAGIANLRELARHTETELAALHGMGPRAIRILREALDAAGLAFASPQPVARATVRTSRRGGPRRA